MSALEMFALLLAGHAVADYPLQGDFLSKAKNRFAPIAGVPWYQAMGSHAAIHAGVVGIITGSIILALAEFVIHFAIDDTKCRGRISFNTDQTLHALCKVVWAVAAVWVSLP